jgi:hypothetical protein
MVCQVRNPFGFRAGMLGAVKPSFAGSGCTECRHPNDLKMKATVLGGVSRNSASRFPPTALYQAAS